MLERWGGLAFFVLIFQIVWVARDRYEENHLIED